MKGLTLHENYLYARSDAYKHRPRYARTTSTGILLGRYLLKFHLRRYWQANRMRIRKCMKF